MITGITGQDGSFLAELLLDRGYRVSGLARVPDAPLGASEHLRGQIELLAGDLLDHDSLRAAVRRARPDELYHLAAPSYVPDSWERPAQTLAAIAGGTAALLEAIRELDRGTRLFSAASGSMFGAAPESPQHEDTPCRPENPYSVAKLAAHQLLGAMRAHAHAHPAENDPNDSAENDRRSTPESELRGSTYDSLYACSGILYNHESERRPERFVTRKITRAAAAVKLGLAREVVLGDLRAVRDWSFAGDVMRGAWLMLQQERPADYILASGVARTVADFADAAFACLGLRAEEHIRVDPALVRAPEETPLVGDPGRARRELGWEPHVGFEELVQRMVRADLQELGGDGA